MCGGILGPFDYTKLTHGELPGTVNVACVLMKTNSAGHMWWCLAWRGVCALGRRNIPPLAFSPYSRSKTTKGCLATKMMTRHEVLLGAVLFDQTARRKHMLHSLRKHTPISYYLAVQKSSCVDLPSHAMGLLLSSWLVHAPPFKEEWRHTNGRRPLVQRSTAAGGDEQTLQQTYLPREVQVAFKILMTHWILQFA